MDEFSKKINQKVNLGRRQSDYLIQVFDTSSHIKWQTEQIQMIFFLFS